MTMTERATALNTPPVPVPTAITEFFWEGVRSGELRILRCQACEYFVHYPRPLCNKCGSTDLAPERVSGRAIVYSYTWAVQAFHPYFKDRVPYNVAVVELVEQAGLRMTTNIVDCPPEALRTGMEVQVVFRQVGPELVLPLFRPAPVGTPVSASNEEKR